MRKVAEIKANQKRCNVFLFFVFLFFLQHSYLPTVIFESVQKILMHICISCMFLPYIATITKLLQLMWNHMDEAIKLYVQKK